MAIDPRERRWKGPAELVGLGDTSVRLEVKAELEITAEWCDASVRWLREWGGGAVLPDDAQLSAVSPLLGRCQLVLPGGQQAEAYVTATLEGSLDERQPVALGIQGIGVAPWWA
ncbi:hypothetical protein ACIOK4_00230 [Streptomyces bottropensis]|uniref:hypothetical protein n=1 Tax=Streptomyces bottropensis TaxID=42235 RepID=UPI00380D7CE8